MMQAQNRTEYTNLMLKSENSEVATQQFLTKAKEDFKSTKLPIFGAYIGIGNLFMAKHAGNPFSKLSYFKTGKKFLEKAVSSAPESLEIRFLRYTTQTEMPAFLGYNKNMAEDKIFILDHYKDSKDEVLVEQIKQFLKI
ncbi:hypothetical protein SAMN05443292_0610 [Halpernia frigidisoli]|uniref:Uncharacterized protein n=2 Tax=Halpernia frigidisoli TaxID=1125876 RepID=A0A1I3DP09_9FLAO|nr:hypothetical protein SAMN05443292_0610 [Halpernia frigidisoli]